MLIRRKRVINHTNDRPVGMGDVVAKVAQPIAEVADMVLGTDIAHCGSCEERREKLNQMILDIRHPFSK